MHACPALRPRRVNTSSHFDVLMLPYAIPRASAYALTISGLGHTAYMLAVYASCHGHPLPRKTRFRVLAGLTRAGFYLRESGERFQFSSIALHSPSPGLAWRTGIFVPDEIGSLLCSPACLSRWFKEL